MEGPQGPGSIVLLLSIILCHQREVHLSGLILCIWNEEVELGDASLSPGCDLLSMHDTGFQTPSCSTGRRPSSVTSCRTGPHCHQALFSSGLGGTSRAGLSLVLSCHPNASHVAVDTLSISGEYWKTGEKEEGKHVPVPPEPITTP